MAKPRRLAARRAIITGASRGIGAGAARRIAAEGAAVALVARTLDVHPTLPGSLNETAERCRQPGAEVAVIVADLTDDRDRSRVVPEAVEALVGPIDIWAHRHPCQQRRRGYLTSPSGTTR